jgi:Tol biopolymer transport system component
MQLFAMDADGGQVRRLTQGDGYHYAPAWSPDGSTLAYVRTEGAGIVPATRVGEGLRSDWTIEAIELASLQARIIARGDTAPLPRPVWSPDGEEIAFVSTGLSESPDISVVPAGGGAVRPLLVSTTAQELFVDWR